MPVPFRIGVVFPQTEIEPVAIRDFASEVETLGYSHMIAYDHIVGVDISNRPDWKMPYTSASKFHEPMMLFAFLAGSTKKLLLSTGVVVLPQRQTVLFGKQAANVDIFTGGRLRLALGLGWNAAEYEALGVPFEGRGARFEAQVRLLRRLWTEPSFTEHGRFDRITEAGINPLPLQRPIPIWIGGNSPRAMRRAAEIGDGWLPIFPAMEAEARASQFRQSVASFGRDPLAVEIENIVVLNAPAGDANRTADDAVRAAHAWKAAGASGVAFRTTEMGLRGAAAHLQLFARIASLLGLEKG